MQPGTVDWATVFEGAAWFHVTGITPALGASAAACTREAVEAAKAAGARVSVDLNYRKKLWTEAQAQATMRPLMTYVDVVVANEEDIQSVLGLHVPDTDVTSGQLNLAGYRQVAEQLTNEFGPSTVAITLRESLSASDNGWSAALWDAKANAFYHSQHYTVRLVDRIGGGDSFAAGLIYGLVVGPRTRGRAAVRGGGERAQADDSRRLQPRLGRRGGRAREGRRAAGGCNDSRRCLSVGDRRSVGSRRSVGTHARRRHARCAVGADRTGRLEREMIGACRTPPSRLASNHETTPRLTTRQDRRLVCPARSLLSTN